MRHRSFACQHPDLQALSSRRHLRNHSFHQPRRVFHVAESSTRFSKVIWNGFRGTGWLLVSEPQPLLGIIVNSVVWALAFLDAVCLLVSPVRFVPDVLLESTTPAPFSECRTRGMSCLSALDRASGPGHC